MARVRRRSGERRLSIRQVAAASGLAVLGGLTLIADRPESGPPDAAASSDALESTQAEAARHEGVPEGCGYEGAAGGGGYTGGRVRCGPDDRRQGGGDRPVDENPGLHRLAIDVAYSLPAA
ncbi:MAG: hypothetical protein ACRD2C_17870 [Acidimicrobiales bacterium]